MYEKFKHNELAMEVLVKYVKDIDRAAKFAATIDEPKVYSILGHAQLQNGKVKEGIASFIKAQDCVPYLAVIAAAEMANLFDDLIEYINMCRNNKVKNSTLHTKLCYAYAKTNRTAELTEFINGSHNAQILEVGDQCFNQGLFEAAKILYLNISNYPRLASTCVKMKDYNGAVDAARKANSVRTWKEVCFACVDAEEFRLAQTAGLQIIVQGDELEELSRYYEIRGHWEHLMKLIEQGFASERAHVGMFTQLGLLFSKYRPERLMDHLKLYHARLNIAKLIRVCEENQQYPELVFLYVNYKEPENAINVLIRNSVECWDHLLFKDTIAKCNNPETLYKAVEFYLKLHPLQLVDLLQQQLIKTDNKPDPVRVVALVRGAGHLPLIKPYLIAVQEEDIAEVNEALNEILVDEEDFKGLRISINAHSNFDQIKLAKQLREHSLLEFRRISAELYKKNGQFEDSVTLSKADKLFNDAMKTAAESGKPEVAEDLLRFFVSAGNKEAFAACLFACYDLVRADVALELAWKNKMIDFVMPHLIQFLREYTTKVDALVTEAAKQKEEREKKPLAPPGSMMMAPPGSVMMAPPGSVMLPPGMMPPGMMPGVPPGFVGDWHRMG
eukprot:TRINITY_DN4059_c0_g3_i1.p1 TRINITY_DN4059_c0_g3~~TRINITY_DN4059_c0_g3_i1.p1  ORF type:complete len:641 (+),score=191.85 TRINITY_DN4059_c0_g3_i1:82-1923(+)